MNAADALIEKIVGAARIPSGKRRLDIARELRAHIEDFVLVAQQAGHTDEEIRRLVLANFGDPQEIAGEFAQVYRRERAILRISVFLLSTLTVGTLISAAVLMLQASVAIGLGVPVPRALGGHHLTFEVLYILCTVATYVGFISLETLFDRDRFQKAAASLVLIFALVFGGFALADAHADLVLFGFVSGMLLRAIPIFFQSRVSRIGAALGCFGIFGLVSACRQSPDLQNEAALKIAVWVAIGACCHLMTHLAVRLHRVLLNEIQEV